MSKIIKIVTLIVLVILVSACQQTNNDQLNTDNSTEQESADAVEETEVNQPETEPAMAEEKADQEDNEEAAKDEPADEGTETIDIQERVGSLDFDHYFEMEEKAYVIFAESVKIKLEPEVASLIMDKVQQVQANVKMARDYYDEEARSGNWDFKEWTSDDGTYMISSYQQEGQYHVYTFEKMLPPTSSGLDMLIYLNYNALRDAVDMYTIYRKHGIDHATIKFQFASDEEGGYYFQELNLNDLESSADHLAGHFSWDETTKDYDYTVLTEYIEVVNLGDTYAFDLALGLPEDLIDLRLSKGAVFID